MLRRTDRRTILESRVESLGWEINRLQSRIDELKARRASALTDLQDPELPPHQNTSDATLDNDSRRE